jgi:hypothetical protein
MLTPMFNHIYYRALTMSAPSCLSASHRLRDLQALPYYVVVTQEGAAQVYEVCSNTTL